MPRSSEGGSGSPSHRARTEIDGFEPARPGPPKPFHSPVNPWVLRSQPRPAAAVRLFCFPYAGGAAAVFRAWPQGLPSSVELCAVQIPGRGSRFREPSLRSLPELVQAAASGLRPYFDRPFALFGHSMGALVSFELARELRRLGGPAPLHLFVSGRPAPPLADREPPISHLDDDGFIEELRRRYGAIPDELLSEPELLELVRPILRADVALLEAYRYRQEEPLECPISCFGGEGDSQVLREDLEAWERETRGSFALRTFPGNHFFLDSHREELLLALSDELRRLAGRVGGP